MLTDLEIKALTSSGEPLKRSGTISGNRMLDIMYRMGLRGKATVHGLPPKYPAPLSEQSSPKAQRLVQR